MKTIAKKAYGKNIKITDARDNFSLAINNASGNTEQDTTSGKNLLDCSGLTTQTINGVTFTPVYDDKGLLQYINANGTSSAVSIYGSVTQTYKAGSYIVNGGANQSAVLQVSDSTAEIGRAGDSDYNLVLDTDMEITTRIRLASNYTANNLKFYPMIRLVTITDVTYEPFTNGASPNPSYPQEIKSVVLSEIRTCGKNLIDINNPLYYATISGGVVTQTVNSRFYVIPVKINENYTFSKSVISGETAFYGFYNEIPQIGDTLNNRGVLTNLSSKTITASDNYLCIMFNNYEYMADDIQVEVGTTATPYEPYIESVATLSNPITLNGLNGVWDTLDSKKFKTVVFDGSESGWNRTTATGITNSYAFYRLLTDYKYINSDTLNYVCSNFKAITHNERYKDNTVFIANNSWLVCCPKDITTLTEWKAHLASKPMTVVYELAEPIETPLPDADVEALKSLKTYDGVTHIFTDSEEVEPTLEVEYTLLEAKDEWNYADYILHTDYNRIVGNITYLKAYLDGLFLGLTNISTMEEKNAKSLIYAREINAIETALEQLNLETYKFDIGETKEYLPNTRTLNFEDLNRIESAIFMLAKQMTSHKENLSRLAFTLGNQKGIRV